MPRPASLLRSLHCGKAACSAACTASSSGAWGRSHSVQLLPCSKYASSFSSTCRARGRSAARSRRWRAAGPAAGSGGELEPVAPKPRSAHPLTWKLFVELSAFRHTSIASSKRSASQKGYSRLTWGGHRVKDLSCHTRTSWIASHTRRGGMRQTAVLCVFPAARTAVAASPAPAIAPYSLCKSCQASIGDISEMVWKIFASLCTRKCTASMAPPAPQLQLHRS